MVGRQRRKVIEKTGKSKTVMTQRFDNQTLSLIINILAGHTDSELRNFFFKYDLLDIYVQSGRLTAKKRKVTDVFQHLRKDNDESTLSAIVKETLRQMIYTRREIKHNAWKQFPKEFPELELALRADGYQVVAGELVTRFPSVIEATVQEVTLLLQQPEFKGADEQFRKALGHLNATKPDYENCVKDAISTIESVARILGADNNLLLSAFVKDLANQKVIPKPLDQVFQKLYAYRGNEPGVAHGLVGESEVGVEEAEFILAASAASVIYLIKKRNKITKS